MLQEALDRLCGAGQWKAYCLSLARAETRRTRFSSWAQEVSLPFTFVDAVDKRELDPENLGTHGVVLKGELNLGATACRRSHEMLYEKLLKETKEPYLFILEDDAGFKGTNTLEALCIFLEKARRTSLKWVALQLGYHTCSKIQYQLLNPSASPLLYIYEFADQSHAILWKREALQSVFAICQEDRYKNVPIDHVINVYQRRKKGITVGPEFSLISQTDTESYIGNPSL